MGAAAKDSTGPHLTVFAPEYGCRVSPSTRNPGRKEPSLGSQTCVGEPFFWTPCLLVVGRNSCGRSACTEIQTRSFGEMTGDYAPLT